MKVCVYGAGSVGGVIASRLVLGGADVSVVARGAHLAAMRENGLIVEGPGEKRETFEVRATDRPEELGRQDFVITGVKSHSLPAIAGPMQALLGDDTAVVYAINGLPFWYFYREGGPHDGRRIERLDPAGRLWDDVGIHRAVGCVVSFPAEVTTPGTILRQSGGRGLAFGEPDGSRSERVARIADVFRAGGIDTWTDRPIRQEMWDKLRKNMGSSPTSLLTDLTSGEMVTTPALWEIYKRASTEAGAIAAAYGCPGEDSFEAVFDTLSRLRHRPSMSQDFRAGRPMEVDGQLVAPLELARLAGVEVPTLEVLVALLAARARAAGLYRG